MKIEKVISLAQQAIDFHPSPVFYPMNIKALEKFANLVAEKERQDEREVCAKLCDNADKSTHPSDLAEAIRARSDR